MREIVTFRFPSSVIDAEYWDIMDRIEMMRDTNGGMVMSEIMSEYVHAPLFQAYLLREHADQISAIMRKVLGLMPNHKIVDVDGTTYVRLPLRCIGYRAANPSFYDADFEVTEPTLALVLKLMTDPNEQVAA